MKTLIIKHFSMSRPPNVNHGYPPFMPRAWARAAAVDLPPLEARACAMLAASALKPFFDKASATERALACEPGPSATACPSAVAEASLRRRAAARKVRVN